MIWLLAWRKERQNCWSVFILCFFNMLISLKVSNALMPAHLHADIRDSSIIDEMIVLPIKSLCHSGKMKRPHQYQTQEDEPYLKSMQKSIASSVYEKNMCCLKAANTKPLLFFSLMIFLYLNIYQQIKSLKETPPTHSQRYYVCQQTFPNKNEGKLFFFLFSFIKYYWNIQFTLINFVWQISFILIYPSVNRKLLYNKLLNKGRQGKSNSERSVH